MWPIVAALVSGVGGAAAVGAMGDLVRKERADMDKQKNMIRLIIFIMVGLIVGGIFGEVLGKVLGQIGVISGGGIDNPVRNFFVSAFEPSFGINKSEILDLYMIKLRLGIGFKFNVCSIIGLVTSLYIMKWSK